MPSRMEEGGNPDAAQDKELIMSCIMETIGPFADQVMAKLQELDEKVDRVDDLQMKFTHGLIGAYDTHRRNDLTQEISSKYGKDIEPFEGIHKDFHGKGFSDSLLDELMGDNGPGDEERDGWIQNKLKEAKGKWGKYVGIKDESPEEVGVGEAIIEPASGENAEQEALEGEKEAREGEAEEKMGEEEEKPALAEIETGHDGGEIKKEEEGEHEEEKGEEEEEAGEEEEEDAISKLMREVESLSGKRHKLSEPIISKKKKAPARR
jgi:hypothetical protein